MSLEPAPPAPLEFCFDFLSPYAYVAWHLVRPLARRHGRRVAPVPVVFGALLKHHGTKGPAEVPAKAVYAFKDAARKAHRAGLPPLTLPPMHPFRPLVALRVAGLPFPEETSSPSATSARPESDRERLIDALFAATWAGGGGVEHPEQVAAIADRVGLDGAALVERAGAPEAKDRLRAATDSALARGAFGVPTVFVGDELFWGVDGLEMLDDFLAGRDPLVQPPRSG